MDEIRTFLMEANLKGYAAGSAAKKTKESDGSETIVHENGDWKFHDNYFGGEPFGGREVVFFQGKPVWIMVYYGRVLHGAKPERIYPILMEALRAMPDEAPYRGPKEYVSGDYLYKNSWFELNDDLSLFSGNESISFRGLTEYECQYHGGFVDEHRDELFNQVFKPI